ncbi:MAG: VIT1/CCC1 transporter family protein [Caulobacterales bacterium]
MVIGMADGLTVPFALAAGLSAAIARTDLIVTAGAAEIAAGAIAMGLGGYLAARSDQEHYASEERRERREIQDLTERERTEVRMVFRGFGLEGAVLEGTVDAITSDADRWVAFMMRFELGLERPDPKRAPISAFTIAAAYVAGGLVPLAPYIAVNTVNGALPWSVGLTGLALAVFGAVKGKMSGVGAIKSAIQTLVVGGLAAGAAFGLASLFH